MNCRMSSTACRRSSGDFERQYAFSSDSSKSEVIANAVLSTRREMPDDALVVIACTEINFRAKDTTPWKSEQGWADVRPTRLPQRRQQVENDPGEYPCNHKYHHAGDDQQQFGIREPSAHPVGQRRG